MVAAAFFKRASQGLGTGFVTARSRIFNYRTTAPA